MTTGKHKILYPEAFPVVEYSLERGERIKAESDAMIAMSSTVDVEEKVEGGILGGLARSLLANESFFFQELIARRGPGKVLFGHALPGGILDVELDGSYDLMVQKNGFLAGTEGIQVDTKMQNIFKGLLSGEGFFLVRVSGKGTVFVSSYGGVHPVNLADGEEYIIDNGHLVAWPGYMNYKVERASGWISSITSGEGVVCRFRGPGTVLIQTRNLGGLESWMRRVLASVRK